MGDRSFENLLQDYSISTSEHAQLLVFFPIADSLADLPPIALSYVRELLLDGSVPRKVWRGIEIPWCEDLPGCLGARVGLDNIKLLSVFPASGPSTYTPHSNGNSYPTKDWQKSRPYWLFMEYSALFMRWLVFRGKAFCVGKVRGEYALLPAQIFSGCAAAYEGHDQTEVGVYPEDGFYRPWAGIGNLNLAVDDSLHFIFADDVASLLAAQYESGSEKSGQDGPRLAASASRETQAITSRHGDQEAADNAGVKPITRFVTEGVDLVLRGVCKSAHQAATEIVRKYGTVASPLEAEKRGAISAASDAAAIDRLGREIRDALR